jgi:hypothetical protein
MARLAIREAIAVDVRVVLIALRCCILLQRRGRLRVSCELSRPPGRAFAAEKVLLPGGELHPL